MPLKEKLEAEVQSTFATAWMFEVSTDIPTTENLRLNSNHAKDLEMATVLYADLNGSTKMVDGYSWEFCAEVYKTFLRCSAEIIRENGGTITAYDGDRIMAIFVGASKNTSAVKCALKINWATKNIIQPALDRQYPEKGFKLQHIVGVDTSRLHAARTGVRGDNDLVWVGRAANHAAKLTSVAGHPTWISKAVYDAISNEAKFSSGVDMWTSYTWSEMNGSPTIYGSNYWWKFD